MSQKFWIKAYEFFMSQKFWITARATPSLFFLGYRPIEDCILKKKLNFKSLKKISALPKNAKPANLKPTFIYDRPYRPIINKRPVATACIVDSQCYIGSSLLKNFFLPKKQKLRGYAPFTNFFYYFFDSNPSAILGQAIKTNGKISGGALNNFEKRIEYLNSYHRSNQDTCLVHKPIVNSGEWVESGDLLADSSASMGGELAIGKNILVAYMPWEGYNFEDAILINERLVYDDVYTSIHIERYEIETKENLVGSEQITRKIPDIPLEACSHLDYYGIASIGSWIEEGDILVGKITPVNKKKLTPYQALLYKLLDKKKQTVRDCSLRAPKGIKANVINVQILEVQTVQQNVKKPKTSTKKAKTKKAFKGGALKAKTISKENPNQLALSQKKKKPLAIINLAKKQTFKGSALKAIQNRLSLPKKQISKYIQNFKSVNQNYKPTSYSAIIHGNGFAFFFDRPYTFAYKQTKNIRPIKKKTIADKEKIFNKKSQKQFLGSKDKKINKAGVLAFLNRAYTSLLQPIKKPNLKEFIKFSVAKLYKKPFKGGALKETFKGGALKETFKGSALKETFKGGALKNIIYTSRPENDFFFIDRQQQMLNRFNKKKLGQRSLDTNLKPKHLVPDVNKAPYPSKKSSLLRAEPLIATFLNNPKADTQKKIPTIVHIYLAEKRKIQVGDKMAGRHGNKGIISNILPRQDMPYLPDGTAIDIVLNPLGVPSRMNVGQIYECLLGLAGKYLGEHYKIFPFDEIYGAEASRSFVFAKLFEARQKIGFEWLFDPDSPGKIRLIDGRTGECFHQPVTVGIAYMLKLVHMVDDKIHMRSTGPYSLVTQQPLRGRAKQGGQRLGEMEVWAIEGYGAAFVLLEMLTIKSDDMTGRLTLWSNLILNKELTIGTPEAFKVLVCELQALCLDIGLYVYKSEALFMDKGQSLLGGADKTHNNLAFSNQTPKNRNNVQYFNTKQSQVQPNFKLKEISHLMLLP